MARHPVEMVRIEREEEHYDREQVLGRDTSSVFPTEAKEKEKEEVEALKEAVGASRFISETELEDLRKSGGADRPEVGTLAPDKPLSEILREQKEKKEEEFQDKWRRMKQGKNRPLDADEYTFVKALYEKEDQHTKQWEKDKEEDLSLFREAVKASRSAQVDGTEEKQQDPLTRVSIHKPERSQTKRKGLPGLPVKRVIKPKEQPDQSKNDEQATKRPRVQVEESITMTGGDGQPAKDINALGGLLGDYNSSSD
ncbi:unnamed protein product [Ostreobium quekettii]|uniref:FAM192A/Fyv6 N-terminal domain-containing protein n=1 Tax=Ostreobium quekettii TaxID=121088 RepID=A0A8S1IV95_9CHLO|nr:unnamed protein product [Ostreobium quekettii]|eukprot:evm.model.scf_167.8 EVM.evm.TU.scf_167.8   scf_167:61474-65873(-)